jgi:hypothetical protein
MEVKQPPRWRLWFQVKQPPWWRLWFQVKQRYCCADGGGDGLRGEKKKVGPVTVINWNPQELSPDLNPAWIQKQVKG